MKQSLTLPDLHGRVAIVTGASGGIGLWTAAGLAKAGAAVVLIARDGKRGEAAQKFVAEHGNCPPPDLYLADFASLKEVDRLSGNLLWRYPVQHILVNNAGLFVRSRELTVDGYERTFAVNHLAPFLLTNRLLAALEKGGREGRGNAHIVTVASMAAQRATIDLDDLMSKRHYSMLGAYSTSKLANILFANELARRLAGKPMVSNSLHPGVVATGIGDKGGMAGAVWGLIKPFLLSAEKGAVNSLYVAASPEADAVSGAFFVKQRPAPANPIADDKAIAARLWNESESLIGAAIGKFTGAALPVG